MTAPILLSARHLQKQFGAVVAAQDLCIDIAIGQRVSLIGSNGAGKTTFVNMITGYLKPDQGSIYLGETDITPMSPRQITRLGVARSFQIPQLYPTLSVMDNMLVAMACHGNKLSVWRPAAQAEEIERGAALLERFELIQHRNRRVSELPGGVRKLLDIALAMTGSPKLLLLDEPVAGMTDQETERTAELFTSLAGKHSLVVVEHDMAFVEALGGKVTVLCEGSVLAEGDLATVQADPRVIEVYLGR